LTRVDDWVNRILARQKERRRQGLATVSLLLGDQIRAKLLWTQSAQSRPNIAVPAAGLSVKSFLVAIGSSIDLVPFATAELNRRGVHVAEYQPSCADWELAWADAGVDDVAAVGRAICLASVADAPMSDRFMPIVTGLGPGSLTAMARLLGDVRPMIWIDGLAGTLADHAETIVDAALAIPEWGIGANVGDDDLNWLRASPPSRTVSLLLTGVIPPPPPDASPAEDYPDDDVETFDDGSKSQAEHDLFTALKADPETTELFALNVRLDFLFGKSLVEADLYAESLRLVIEIDGWHHFQKPANYRRDRRKDWAYGQHGYRVHRELAEDVMTDLPGVLDRVRQRVQDCRVARAQDR
jgi:very-short-patch-repair endonuclease